MSALMPAVAIICAILLLIPAPHYVRTRNVPLASLILWLIVINVIYAVSAIMWSGNTQDKALIWCDITTAIVVGMDITIPSIALCMALYLARAATGKPDALLRPYPRIWIQSLFCFTLPPIFVALHAIVQDNRYDILADIGCRPTTYTSAPALFLFWLPPLALAIAALLICALSLRTFRLRRHRPAPLPLALPASPCPSTPISAPRFARLLALASLLASYALLATALDLHAHLLVTGHRLLPLPVPRTFSNAPIWPTQKGEAGYDAGLRGVCMFLWWSVPLLSVVVVGLLAFGHEVVEEWARYLQPLVARLGRGREEQVPDNFMPEMDSARRSPLLSYSWASRTRMSPARSPTPTMSMGMNRPPPSPTWSTYGRRAPGRKNLPHIVTSFASSGSGGSAVPLSPSPLRTDSPSTPTLVPSLGASLKAKTAEDEASRPTTAKTTDSRAEAMHHLQALFLPDRLKLAREDDGLSIIASTHNSLLGSREDMSDAAPSPFAEDEPSSMTHPPEDTCSARYFSPPSSHDSRAPLPNPPPRPPKAVSRASRCDVPQSVRASAPLSMISLSDGESAFALFPEPPPSPAGFDLVRSPTQATYASRPKRARGARKARGDTIYMTAVREGI